MISTATTTPAERVRPFLLLPVAIICLTCAGVIYWWPAVNPGLQTALNFTPNQADVLVAVAGSGSTVGILGGLFHDRHGTRATVLAGAAGLLLTFASFGVLAVIRPLALGALLFPLAVVLVVAVVTFSFMLYSSCIAAAAAVFAPRYRGRVVGLCSAAFGGSAAVLTAVQTALFPSLDDTAPLLFFTAALCLIPAALAIYVFPRAERFDESKACVPGEDAPLLDQPNALSTYVDSRLSNAYSIAWVYVALLQTAAITDVLGASRIVRVVVAGLVVTGLCAFMLLNANSSLTVAASAPDGQQGHTSPTDAEGDQPEPAFLSVLLDRRYLYECLHCVTLVGGGGIALLVQAPHIVKGYGIAAGAAAVGEWVRTLVALFAACNITARLAVGSVMDRGASAAAREIYKFRLMHANALVMAAGFGLLALGSRAAVLGGTALVGLSYGSFFAVAAALTTVWFGVRNFPRNFACIGPFIATGAGALASGMPMWVRGVMAQWSGADHSAGNGLDAARGVCEGAWCVRPALLSLALLHVVTYVVGLAVWPRVRKGAYLSDGVDGACIRS